MESRPPNPPVHTYIEPLMSSRSRTRLWRVFLSVALALSALAPLAASGTDTGLAVLRKISSRVQDHAGVIAIEASEPVPYVASQPDAKTFVVELRNVLAMNVTDAFKVDPRVPVAGVRVENTHAFDGSSVARVQMTLSEAVRPRVRSSKNMIFVEADRLDRAPATASVPMGPAAVIRDLQVTRRDTATAVTFRGTGRLVPMSVEESKDEPARLYVELDNATSALPGLTPVGQGTVQNVRIAPSPKGPLVTRIALELQSRAAYHVEPTDDGAALTVLVEDAPVASKPGQGRLLAAAPQPAVVSTPAVVPVAMKPMLAQAPPSAPTPGTMGPVAAPVVAQIPATPITPTAAPAQAPGVAQAPAAAPRYTGNPVSLDFQGADLRAVLRTFAEISGLNIVIDPTIQGNVDVALRDVPWDQALDIILRANKLGYSVDGTIVRVAPLTVLAEEEVQRRKLSDEQALSGELRVLTRSLSYAKAEELKPLLTATVLSQRGSIQVDARTNTIIINDLSDRLQRASDLMSTLDSPQPQVEIEARIVQATKNFAHDLGVQWGFNGKADAALGNTTPLNFPNNGTIGGNGGVIGAGARAVPSAVNLPVQGATSNVGLALGSINGAFNLDVALSALEKTGNGRILSTPKVTTQNNIAAEMTQGTQIPIQTISNNTVTVSFKDAALTLKVTPQITAAKTVIMSIVIENSQADFTRAVNGIPPINTQRANTSVLVNDGDTTVIGGVFVSNDQYQQDRTPSLYRLPLLGWLFKRDHVQDESSELLIFITPRIMAL